MAEHGGARGDISGFVQGFDNRCPSRTVDVEDTAVGDARTRSGSRPCRFECFIGLEIAKLISGG